MFINGFKLHLVGATFVGLFFGSPLEKFIFEQEWVGVRVVGSPIWLRCATKVCGWGFVQA